MTIPRHLIDNEEEEDFNSDIKGGQIVEKIGQWEDGYFVGCEMKLNNIGRNGYSNLG